MAIITIGYSIVIIYLNLSVGKGSFLDTPQFPHLKNKRNINSSISLHEAVQGKLCSSEKKRKKETQQTNRCVVNIKNNIWSQVTNTFREESKKKNVTRLKVIHGCGLLGSTPCFARQSEVSIVGLYFPTLMARLHKLEKLQTTM